MYQAPPAGFCSLLAPYSLIWYGRGCAMPRASSELLAAATLATGSLGSECQLTMSGTTLLALTKSRYCVHQPLPVDGTPARLGPTISCDGNAARMRWYARRHSSKYCDWGRFQNSVMFGSFQMSHSTGSPLARTSLMTRVRKLS